MDYRTVPKEPTANLRWRLKLLDACHRDRGRQQAVRDLCKRDILFWVNACLFTYDPRRIKTNPHLPFITWPFQDEVILKIKEWLGLKSIGIDKSRDMGASWMSQKRTRCRENGREVAFSRGKCKKANNERERERERERGPNGARTGAQRHVGREDGEKWRER
jgi:hypothetical protein